MAKKSTAPKRPKVPAVARKGGPITPTVVEPSQHTVRILVDEFITDYGYDTLDDYFDEHPDDFRTVIAMALDSTEAAFKALTAWRDKWPKEKLYGMFVEKNVESQILFVP